MPLLDAAVSSVLQLLVIGGLPFLGFWLYNRRRHKTTLLEAAARAGLRPGEPRYLLYGVILAVSGAIAVLLWSPNLEPLTREGSAQRQFVGLGLGVNAMARAFLYGVVQTAFAEELLFRGLIAGSLSRRFSLLSANLLQAFIFFLPHLAVLLFAPDLAGILPIVFLGALVLGWLRIRSGSILGGLLMHASGNVTIALLVAARTGTRLGL